MDIIIKTKNVINAVQNKPSIWNTELNSSEEKKELAWTIIAGIGPPSVFEKPGEARKSLRT